MQDLLVVAEYIDRALTGTTDKRPSFLQMIEDSKKKIFDYVLVYQLDRFARNRYDSANYKAKLKKNGVRVLSAKENITEDASGILIEGVLESMAEYYSAELSQKVKRGIRESYEKGYFIGGYGLFGYDIVDKKWTINSYEADIVRDIFTRYKNGEKAKEIIARLNGQGIKTKAGSSFNMNSLARIIRNEKYIGKDELEAKISLEKAKQIKPLEVDKVKAFLDFFAHRKYENDQEKNEFFNSFINRVVLYDDKILIFYNTDTNRPAVIKRKDTDDLLLGSDIPPLLAAAISILKFPGLAKLTQCFSFITTTPQRP